MTVRCLIAATGHYPGLPPAASKTGRSSSSLRGSRPRAFPCKLLIPTRAVISVKTRGDAVAIKRAAAFVAPRGGSAVETDGLLVPGEEKTRNENQKKKKKNEEIYRERVKGGQVFRRRFSAMINADSVLTAIRR